MPKKNHKRPLWDYSVPDLIAAYRAGEIHEADFTLWMQRRGQGFDTIMNVIAEN